MGGDGNSGAGMGIDGAMTQWGAGHCGRRDLSWFGQGHG
jgi:hypothetical protein